MTCKNNVLKKAEGFHFWCEILIEQIVNIMLRYTVYQVLIYICHVYSANSILKLCKKSTHVNFLQNQSKSLSVPYLQECVIFFLTLILCEYSGKWMQKKIDIQYKGKIKR